jgi:hypothetical protein
MQGNVLLGFAAFYNPWNLLQAFRRKQKESYRRKSIFYQLWGMATLVRTAWMLRGYLWGLWRGPIKRVREWPEKFRRSGSPYLGLIPAEPAAPDAPKTQTPTIPQVTPLVPGQKNVTAI